MQRIPAITSVSADKAEAVKYNLPKNKAESFKYIRMHFEGEKIVDRSQAGSFTSRAHGTEAIIFQFLCLFFSVQLLPIEIKCLIIRCLYFRPVDGIRDVMRPDKGITVSSYIDKASSGPFS